MDWGRLHSRLRSVEVEDDAISREALTRGDRCRGRTLRELRYMYIIEANGKSMLRPDCIRCNANYILLVNTVLLPLCMLVVPLCKALALLALVVALMGFNMGFIDCLANLQMINIYGEAVAPFLHALHFCYGMGAFVSPMIVEPFLLNEDCSIFVDDPRVTRVNTTDMPAKTLVAAQQMTHVRYAFWILAAVQALIPGLVLSLVLRVRARCRSKLNNETDDASDDKSDSTLSVTSSNGQQAGRGGSEKLMSTVPPERVPLFKSQRTQILVIVTCTAVLLFIYDGLQSSFGGYVYSYALKSREKEEEKLKKTEGAYLNALFWGSFAVGRLISIVLATKFTPAFMLLSNIMGCLFSLTLMMIMRHSHFVLYVGTGVFGLFLSSVAPTSISLAEMYIDINSSITSVLVVVAALGEMICPVIVGNLFVAVGPASFLTFNDIMCFLSVAVFSLLWLVGRTAPKYLVRQESSFVWCRMCCIRKDAVGGTGSHSTQTIQHVKYLRKNESESSNIEMSLVGAPGTVPQAPTG